MRPRGLGRLAARVTLATPAVLLGLALALLVTALLAQPAESPPDAPDVKADTPEPAPPAEGQAGTEEEKKEADEPVRIEHADLLTYDPEKNVYYLSTLSEGSGGPVHFIHKDTHLYCDKAEYNEDEDTARSTGNLKIVQPDTTITGDLITADFDDEVADITGNVRLVTKKQKKAAGEPPAGEEPKAADRPAGEAPKEEEPGRWDEYKEKLTTVTCEHIRYWYEQKNAIATGNVVAEQEDKKCFADEAEYVEKDDLLTVKGNPVRVEMTNGNRFQTPWAKVEVEGERFWTGGFTGTFKREKKDETGDQPPAEGTATPGPPPEQK